MSADAPSPNVTRLLQDASSGDSRALRELFPLVYGELRELASYYMRGERVGHTLQPTALVNEAYLRLVGGGETHWRSRVHFFAVAAQGMRRILVDHARRHNAEKRGGGRVPVSLDAVENWALDDRSAYLVALDEALERLAELDRQTARVVELRFFGGMTVKEVADMLGISPRTVKRDWQMAKGWLHREIMKGEDGGF